MDFYLTIFGAALILTSLIAFLYGRKEAVRADQEGSTSKAAVFIFVGFASFAMGSLIFFLGVLELVQPDVL